MTETTFLEQNITAKAFFTLLKKLRWIILQDAAVFIGVHKENILCMIPCQKCFNLRNLNLSLLK